MNIKDSIIATKSLLSDEASQPVFINKNQEFITDLNSSYQSNQVIFQTQSLENSQMMHNFQESFVVFPMVGHLVTTKAISLTQAKYAMILKSHDSIVSTCEVEIDRTKVIQEANYLCLKNAFEEYSTGSNENTSQNAGLENHLKCDPKAWTYSTANGLHQNRLRLHSNPNDLHSNDAIKSNVNYLDVEKEAIISDTVNGEFGNSRLVAESATEYVYYFTVVVRMRKLIPLFSKLPLLQGCYMQLKFKINQVTNYVIDTVVDGPGLVVNGTVATANMAYDTCPFMNVTTEYDLIDGTGTEHTDGYTNKLTMSLKLVENGIYKHEITRPRFYISSYTPSPIFMQELLSLPPKVLRFHDFIVSKLENNTGNVSLNLSSSQRDIEKIVVIPVLSKVSNGTTNVVNGLGSAFTGMNASPINIKRMNLRVANTQLYSNGHDFDYERFMDEMDGGDSYDSNLRQQTTTHGITYDDFQNVHKYYVFNTSRFLSPDAPTSTSYQLEGAITNGKIYDFYVIMYQRNTFTIDTMTSKVVRV